MPRGTVEASSEVWRDRVMRWKQSGLTAKRFAEREGIARPGALSWWRYHLTRADQKKAASKVTSAPLKLIRLEPVSSKRGRQPQAERDGLLEIVSGPHRVVVSSGFDAALRRVLEITGSAR